MVQKQKYIYFQLFYQSSLVALRSRRLLGGRNEAADLEGMHDHERYELVKGIGSGNFGLARLVRDKLTRELVPVKYIEHGKKVRGLIFSLSLCGVACLRVG